MVPRLLGVQEVASSILAVPTTARSSIAERLRDMQETEERNLPRRPKVWYDPAVMGPKKEEILKHAREAQEAEKRRRGMEAGDNAPPRKMASGMPLGCWLWILGIGYVIYLLLKKAGVV